MSLRDRYIKENAKELFRCFRVKRFMRRETDLMFTERPTKINTLLEAFDEFVTLVNEKLSQRCLQLHYEIDVKDKECRRLTLRISQEVADIIPLKI